MFDMPVDIENEKIRDGINTELDNATESSSLTPYIALEKVRKILMPYHIHVPRYLFKDDEHGILTFEARQFGDIYGMKDDGQVYTKDEYPYLLYFEYQKNEIGMYDVFCEIIDRADLAEIQNDLEEEGDDLMESFLSKAIQKFRLKGKIKSKLKDDQYNSTLLSRLREVEKSGSENPGGTFTRYKQSKQEYKAKFGYNPPQDMSAGAMRNWTNSSFKYGPGISGDPSYEVKVIEASKRAKKGKE